jgi:hypothetical protein
MKVLHQTGHNWKWNLDSLCDDQAGAGLILSPVNIPSGKLSMVPPHLRPESFFDPQVYLPKDVKGQLATYKYFPGNLQSGIQTTDYEQIAATSARECIKLQLLHKLGYVTIPTRYYEELPSTYLKQWREFFVEPFLEYYKEVGSEKPILLTVIAKPIQLTDPEQKSDLLNWITGIQELTGVYLILENSFPSKQIKDAQYLASAMEFMHALRMNRLEVHLGYMNTEAFLYSIADPTSVSIGSYENLRSFGIRRFVDEEKKPMRGPNPRLYSGALLQWIDYGYVEAMRSLYADFSEIVESSPYKPLMFTSAFKWHFQNPNLYKHYFKVFDAQVAALPAGQSARIEHVNNRMEVARQRFDAIRQSGVVLDSDSDGSHLPFWMTAVNLYKKYLDQSGQ